MYVGKIIFPIPEEEGLSYAAYLIYQSQTNMMSYYTIERNDSGEYPELCSYDLAGAMPTRESRGEFAYNDDRDFLSEAGTKMGIPAETEMKDGMWRCDKCGEMNHLGVNLCSCGNRRESEESEPTDE